MTVRRMALCMATLAACALPRLAIAEADPVARFESIDFRRVVNDAKASVFPAVVFIKCVGESHDSGRKQAHEQAGSGVIVSPGGEVLTNWHVVEKAIDVRCLLHDGRALDARIVGRDKDLDLAVLQLAATADTGDLPHATLGDSAALREGDFVMAMGAPWGLSRSVSIGIVSCARRFLPDLSEYSLWLQTDAAISPGNSGGPLVNTDGAVVGINTLATRWGGDMGFAIPANVIRLVLPRIREHGEARWSWLGLRLQPIRDFSRNQYFEGTEGVIVAGTDPQSPARQAGIRERDRILGINAERVTGLTEEDLPAIRRRLGLLPRGRPARIEIQRDDQHLMLEVTPRQKGTVEGEELDCPRWDLTVKSINQFGNPDLYYYRRQGAFIFGLETPGNGSDAGLWHQDIILKIGDREIQGLADAKAAYEAALANLETRSRVRVTVLRRGLFRQHILDFSRDYDRE